jgi:hypothetical protein
MSKYHCGAGDHIVQWHLVEHSPSLLHAPAFGIHINKAIPNKDVGLATTLNNLLMNTSALLKGQLTGTSIQE